MALSLGWSIAALAGFVLLYAGVLHFARRGLDGSERLVVRDATGAGVLVLVGLALWMLGLYNA